MPANPELPHGFKKKKIRSIELASAWRKEKASRQTFHKPPGSTHVSRLRYSQEKEASRGQVSFRSGISKRVKRRLATFVIAADLQVRLTSQWLLDLDFEKCCSEYLGKIVP